MTAFKLIVLKEIKKFLIINAKRNISISHNHQQEAKQIGTIHEGNFVQIFVIDIFYSLF